MKLTPKIDTILSIIQNQLTWPAALSEFVDNSFGPDAGDAKEVEITIERNRITIIDDGEGFRDINELYQLGSGQSRNSSRDIGLYGIGSKQAQLWIGSRISVDTVRDGLCHRHSVQWPVKWTKGHVGVFSDADWPNPYNGRGSRAGDDDSGTAITIERLHPGRPRLHIDAVAQQLGQTYAPAIRAGRSIFLTDKRKKLVEHICVRPDQPPELTDIGTFQGCINDMPYALFVGRQDKYEARHNKLFISFGHRVILAERNPWKDRPLPSHFYGRIELGDEWKRCLSANKIDIASYKEELLEDALKKCGALIKAYDEYEKELKVEIFLHGFASDISKRLKLVPKSTGGEYGPGEIVRDGKGKGSGTPGREAVKDAGECKAKEIENSVFPLAIRLASLDKSADCVRPNGEGFIVEINQDIPYVDAAFKSPFDASALWALVTSALVDHLMRAKHKLASGYLQEEEGASMFRAWWLKNMPPEYAAKSKRQYFEDAS